MSAPVSDHVDALSYLERALELLPADPRTATAADLHRLAAINEGTTRFVKQVHGALLGVANRLARHLLHSDDAPPAELVDEYLVLQVLHRRCERADRRLNAYTLAAFRSHGINPAGLPVTSE